MRDIPVEKHFGNWFHFMRDELRQIRCIICRCIPRITWAHKVSDEVRRRCGYEMLTTCDSHYCRSKDEAPTP